MKGVELTISIAGRDRVSRKAKKRLKAPHRAQLLAFVEAEWVKSGVTDPNRVAYERRASRRTPIRVHCEGRPSILLSALRFGRAVARGLR